VVKAPRTEDDCVSLEVSLEILWQSLSSLLFGPGGATVSKVRLLFGIGFGEWGRHCSISFFIGRAFLWKKATGAASRSREGTPSSFKGFGPSY
jgi:hypothetical protein